MVTASPAWRAPAVFAGEGPGEGSLRGKLRRNFNDDARMERSATRGNFTARRKPWTPQRHLGAVYARDEYWTRQRTIQEFRVPDALQFKLVVQRAG